MSNPSENPFIQSSGGALKPPAAPRYMGLVKISWTIIIILCVCSFFPGLTFASWAVAIPVFITTTLMGIVTILRGGKSAGWFLVVMSLFVCPFIVMFAPAVSFVFGIANKARQEVNDRAEKKANGENTEGAADTLFPEEKEPIVVRRSVVLSMKDTEFEVLLAEAERQYQILTSERRALDANDQKAVAAFNQKADAYKDAKTVIDLRKQKLSESPTQPEKYETLTGEGLAGSGFVIRYGDRFLGVASLHQFDGGTPARLVALEGESASLDPANVIKQNDVQILPVKSPTPKLQFLSYHSEFSIRAGDEVFVFGPAGDCVIGVLSTKGMRNGAYQSFSGPRELEVHLKKPIIMAGGSGGPIILKETGAVIGVMLTADDAMQARIVGFETLCIRDAE